MVKACKSSANNEKVMAEARRLSLIYLQLFLLGISFTVIPALCLEKFFHITFWHVLSSPCVLLSCSQWRQTCCNLSCRIYTLCMWQINIGSWNLHSSSHKPLQWASYSTHIRSWWEPSVSVELLPSRNILKSKQFFSSGKSWRAFCCHFLS